MIRLINKFINYILSNDTLCTIIWSSLILGVPIIALALGNPNIVLYDILFCISLCILIALNMSYNNYRYRDFIMPKVNEIYYAKKNKIYRKGMPSLFAGLPLKKGDSYEVISINDKTFYLKKDKSEANAGLIKIKKDDFIDIFIDIKKYRELLLNNLLN